MAVTAVFAIFLQSASYYQARKALKIEDEIGYIVTNGQPALKKSTKNPIALIPENGSSIYSGDTITTFNETVFIEFPSLNQKISILPESNVTIYKNKSRIIQVCINRGFVLSEVLNSKSELSKNNLAFYKLNEKNEYADYLEVDQLNTNLKNFKILKIEEIFNKAQPQIKISWESNFTAEDAIRDDLRLELWQGLNKEKLSLYRVYPLDAKSLVESIRSDQFYWQLRLRKNDENLEATKVSFWKNDYREQIHLIYPNQNEVINQVLNTDEVQLKWAKSVDIKDSIVQVYSDQTLTNKIFEKNIEYKNEINFQPKQYGAFFWRVNSRDGRVLSDVRKFHVAPLVSNIDVFLAWDARCETKQFFYDEPLLYLNWQNNYQYPIDKYKVTLYYFQSDPTKNDFVLRKESFFTDKTELYFKLDSVSAVKATVQAYNSKMRRVGVELTQSFELARRDRNELVGFSQHSVALKNELVTDRNFSLNPDPSTVSANYDYKFQVLDLDGNPVHDGTFEKGRDLSLAGLPVGHYKLKINILKKMIPDMILSQFFSESNDRNIASLSGLDLSQTVAVKIIPQIDYNLERSVSGAPEARNPKIIEPQVKNVQIKE